MAYLSVQSEKKVLRIGALSGRSAVFLLLPDFVSIRHRIQHNLPASCTNSPRSFSRKMCTPTQRKGVLARIIDPNGVMGKSSPWDIGDIIETLRVYHQAEGKIKDAAHQDAVNAAKQLKGIISDAVNSKNAGLRSLQTTILNSNTFGALKALAARREPVAYETMQILCYRNTIACQHVVAEGIVDRMAIEMPYASVDNQCSMCFLLTAIAAFSEASHSAINVAGLIPLLVGNCRKRKPGEDETEEMLTRLANRSAAVLRNLAHNTKEHTNLIKAGAVDVLADISRQTKDPVSRINAALAVACLVGHEETNPRLQLEEEVVIELLQVLTAANQGMMAYGIFWTVWKLCQGLANLSGNDKNKALITSYGGVDLMADVLLGRHHNNEAAHRYALSTIWNLAFNDNSRKIIIATPGLVDAIRTILATTESPKTREVAKGALWTLGVELEAKNNGMANSIEFAKSDLPENTAEILGNGGHIMLSYEWEAQQSVMLIKNELQNAGYQTWMDVDEMSGSTLEAMAKAVEGSAAVLVCLSSKYKESQACRTEAEYAFQQRKKIIPLVMEKGYKPTGWLGALMGTRLYFNMSDVKSISSKTVSLCKELGDDGKMLASNTSTPNNPNLSGSSNPSGVGNNGPRKVLDSQPSNSGVRPETWTQDELEEWLKVKQLSEYALIFREKNMDGLALSGLLRMASDMRMVHEILANDFQMSSIGHRLRIIEELHRLFA